MKEVLYIYTRVSTTSQKDEGTSLDEQKRLGIAKAKELGMDYEVHSEGAKSGSGENITDREVISNLLSLVNQGHVKHLYVYNQDRLSRDTYVSARINHDLRKKNVTVHTSYGSYDTNNPQDKLMMELTGLIADYENTIRTARLKTGRFIKAKQGYWVLGSTPFGYRLGKNKKLVEDKTQSPWVKKMFSWYEQGLSLPDIKQKLDGKVETNNVNRRTGEKGLIWSQESVRSVLTNTHHKGFYKYLGVEIPCPAIVSPELWETVNKEVSDRTSRRPTTTGKKLYDYKLRPLMTCGNCGSKINGMSTKSKGGTHRFAYVCSSRDKKYKKGDHTANWERDKYCPNTVSFESERTEDLVWETLYTILKESHQRKEQFKGLSLSSKRISQKDRDNEVRSLQFEIERIENSIERLQDGISDKEIEKISNPSDAKSIDRFIEKLKVSIDGELLKLTDKQNSLSSLLNDSIWIDWVKDYHDSLKQSDLLSRDEKNEEIKKYVDQIKVSFVPERRTHVVNLRLKLPLIGDSIEYKDKNKKSKGYTVNDGSFEKEIELPTNNKYVGKNR